MVPFFVSFFFFQYFKLQKFNCFQTNHSAFQNLHCFKLKFQKPYFLHWMPILCGNYLLNFWLKISIAANHNHNYWKKSISFQAFEYYWLFLFSPTVSELPSLHVRAICKFNLVSRSSISDKKIKLTFFLIFWLPIKIVILC